MLDQPSPNPSAQKPIAESAAPPANDKPTKKKKKQPGPKGGDSLGRKIGTVAVEIILAGAVGTGLWLLGERLCTHGHENVGSVLIYVAFLMYFATVPLAASGIWKKRKKRIWFGYLIFGVIAAFIFFYYSRAPDQFLPAPAPQPIINTKQQIRALLDEINPQILRMIDAGNKAIPVMICEYHGEKLMAFANSLEGSHYLVVQRTTALAIGGNNKIGNYLNDQDNAVTTTGYLISPKDGLKSVAQ